VSQTDHYGMVSCFVLVESIVDFCL